jgi:alkaline phosphatase
VENVEYCNMKFLKQPISLLMFVCILFINCRSGAKVIHETAKKPLNIILMIGDGMGLSQISAASFINGGLALDLFTIIGLVRTSSGDDYITDSAAGATAYSCGIKSYNGAIGVGMDSLPVKTILEMAEEKGLSTGLVATCSITHATPAAFFAHQKSRTMDIEIANDLYHQNVDVVIGGGKPYFDLSKLQQAGYTVSTGNAIDWDASYPKYFYFFNDSIHPPSMSGGRGDFLIKGTHNAIKSLHRNKKGFFLMVEGSQIDWGGHDNDFNYTVEETVDFDKSVKAAYEFAKKDGNTLVIVTADHETGGLALNGGSLKDKTIVPAYTTGHHTGIMVPIYAYGPGAESFGVTMENTEVFTLMKGLLGL